MNEEWAGGAFGIKEPTAVNSGGDVVGPGSSTPNNIAVFADSSGTVIADGGVSIAQLQAGADFATLTVGASGADYTTIQGALDNIGANGGTIWLLDPSYSISSTLLVKSSRVEIIGKGNGSRIFCDGSVVTTLFKANSTTFQGVALRNVLLEQTNGTVQGIAIDASNMSLCIYDNVRILNFGTAIKADDTANNTFYNTFRNIKIFECNNGIDLTTTNPINDNGFYDIRISLRAGGAGTGLKMNNAQGNAFYDFNVEPATGAGITGIALTTANVLDTLFVNLYAENNATNVSIGSGVVRTTFIGGTNTLATSTNLSDLGSQTAFFNHRLGAVLLNQFSPFVAKDGGNASSIAGSFVNNTSFAHTGSTLVKMELLNATDSSAVLTMANAGTGNYITAPTWSVSKAGDATFNNLRVNGDSNVKAADLIVGPQGDYTDIQSALDALGTDGGTIFVQDGTYTITAPGGLVPLRNNTRLLLSGGAIVQCNGTTVPILFSAPGKNRIFVQGGKWLQTTASAVGVGFDVTDCSDSTFMPTRVEEFNIGLRLDDTTNVTFYNRFRDIQFFNCNTCLQIGVTSTSTQPNNHYFEALRCRPKTGGAGYGVRIADARGLTFVGCDFEPGAGGSAGITNVSLEQNATSLGVAREIVFINCWIENAATGVNIASGVTRATFIGCSITSNTTIDIVDNGTDTTFIGTSKTGTTTGVANFSVFNGLNKVPVTIIQNDVTNNPRALSITNAGTAAALLVDANGNTAVSTSVGGAALFELTGSTGSGVVIYSNQSTPQSGARLLSVRANQASYDQALFGLTNAGSGYMISGNGTTGTGGGISMTSAGAQAGVHTAAFGYSGTSTSGAAGSFTSSNTAFTSLQVTGHEFGHGTIKVSHVGDGISSDANAAALSIDLQNSDAGTGTTAAQGIFITSTTGGTTGKLLNLRNNLLAFGGADAQVEILTLTGDGRVGFRRASPTGMFDWAGGITVASGASAVLDDFAIQNSTVTITGSTNITTAGGFNFVTFGRPTYTSSNAVTVSVGATVYIRNAPAAAGSTTITTPLALWADDGDVRFDGSLLMPTVGSVINFGNGDVTLTYSADNLTLAGGTLSTNDISVATGSAIRTRTTAGNTVLFQARDVDGAAFTTFITLTANNTPTCVLSNVTSDTNFSILTGTAVPAGGTAGAGYLFSSTANLGVFFGSGVPTLSAAQGSLYVRSDGSDNNNRLYVNTNGSTTWTAVLTVA